MIKKAIASESARPNQEAFHSQSFLFNDFVREEPFSVVGPVPTNKQTMTTMIAGITKPMTIRRPVETVSFVR